MEGSGGLWRICGYRVLAKVIQKWTIVYEAKMFLAEKVRFSMTDDRELTQAEKAVAGMTGAKKSAGTAKKAAAKKAGTPRATTAKKAVSSGNTVKETAKTTAETAKQSDTPLTDALVSGLAELAKHGAAGMARTRRIEALGWKMYEEGLERGRTGVREAGEAGEKLVAKTREVTDSTAKSAEEALEAVKPDKVAELAAQGRDTARAGIEAGLSLLHRSIEQIGTLTRKAAEVEDNKS